MYKRQPLTPLTLILPAVQVGAALIVGRVWVCLRGTAFLILRAVDVNDEIGGVDRGCFGEKEVKGEG